MGLRSALVDRARIVRKQTTGPRVLGTTSVVPTHGSWFRCRLDLPMGPEDTTEPGLGAGRRSARKRPQVMFDVRDEDGGTVALSFSDQIEIDSPQLGLATWKVTATPRPIRKKRTVIGWEVTLERVVERQLADQRSIAEQEA